MADYGFTKTIDLPLDAAIEKVTAELAKDGFGILTRIDVHVKLKEKIGVEIEPYVILGACHPASAHQVLQREPDIGLMLPCNVCVYEKGGATVLAVIKPTVAMEAVGNPALADVAGEIEDRLKDVFDRMA